MKRLLFLIFINIVLVIFQSSFFNELLGIVKNPNLVLSFAFALFFLDFDEMSLLSAFIGGIMLDLFGFSIIGISSVTIVGSILFFTYIKKYLFRGFVSNLIFLLLAQYIYLLFINGRITSHSEYFQSGIYTVLTSIVFYYVLRKFRMYFFPSGYTFSK